MLAISTFRAIAGVSTACQLASERYATLDATVGVHDPPSRDILVNSIPFQRLSLRQVLDAAGIEMMDAQCFAGMPDAAD